MMEDLTKSELRIVAGYVDGLTGKEIASKCNLSYNTVVRHTQNIYDKTGIPRSTNALVSWFLTKTFHLDLSEIKRTIGGLILLCLVGFQMAATDFDNSFLRARSARRVEARRSGGRRNRREDDTLTLPGLEG